MTLPLNSRLSALYDTNGTQKDFSFGFRVFFDPDNGGYGLEVRRQTADGYDVIPKSDYLVLPVEDNSAGVVRFSVAPSAGQQIYIAGKTPTIQQLVLTNFGRYSAESIETQFDFITAIIQEWLSSLGEEARQRIAADEILTQYVVQRIDDFVQQVNQNWDDKLQEWDGKSQEIEDYIATIIPSFTQTLREEIEAFAVTGMQDAIDQTLAESKAEIDDAVARANAAAAAAAIAGKLYDTPEAGVDPVTGVQNGAYYNVRSPNDEAYVDEYQNVGGVATATGKSYPSAEKVESIKKLGGVDYWDGGPYPLNGEVRLDSGDVVKSAIPNNTNDPNENMTGWFPVDIETLTPEQFKTYEGDDWTQALVNMFKACTDMPIGSGISANEIRSKLNSNNYKAIRLTKRYRHTKPIHIPPNVRIDQCVSGFFSKNSGIIGLFYDPIDSELDTYAVAPFLYKKDTDGTYSLDTSPYTLPSGGDFDRADYIQTGQRILIEGLSVTTKQGVTLGFRFVGFSGSIANYINVGTNDGSNSRIPKVAVLTNACWNTVFTKPTTLSSNQGWVNWGSNGGMTVSNPYINFGYSAQDVSEITPVYNPTNYTEKGAIAVVNAGDAEWNQPITEAWYFNYVATGYLRIIHPHIEGARTRNAFYFIGSAGTSGVTADITLKPVLTVDLTNAKSSIIYLKDCDIQSAIYLRGRPLGGAPVVRGENSSDCVHLDISRNHFFIQAARWGDLSLIRSINNTWADKIIYVDPVNGNDEAIGLRDTNALKTLSKVKMLAEKSNIRVVNLVSTYTHSGYVTLHKDVIFVGAELIVSGGGLQFNDRNLDVHFNNTRLTSVSGQLPVHVGGTSYGSFSFTCELANQASLINCTGNANLTVNITNDIIANNTFVYCDNKKVYVDLNIKTTTTLTAAPVSSDVVLVNAPHMVGSSAVLEQTVGANERTAISTMTLNGVRLGNAVLLTYSANLNGLDLNGYVSSNNTVSYYFENRTTSSITLAAGSVNAKRV